MWLVGSWWRAERFRSEPPVSETHTGHKFNHFDVIDPTDLIFLLFVVPSLFGDLLNSA